MSMQGWKFWCPPCIPEAQRTSLRCPGRAVGLFDQVVAARRGDDLNVLRAVAHREGANTAPQLIGVNYVRDVVHQQPFEKGPGRVRIPVRWQQDIQHRAGFIGGPPLREFLPCHVETYLIREPHRGSRWRSPSVRSGANLMFRWRRGSWLTTMPRSCSPIPVHRARLGESGSSARGRAGGCRAENGVGGIRGQSQRIQPAAVKLPEPSVRSADGLTRSGSGVRHTQTD